MESALEAMGWTRRRSPENQSSSLAPVCTLRIFDAAGRRTSRSSRSPPSDVAAVDGLAISADAS
jgi:hypothetical protein